MLHLYLRYGHFRPTSLLSRWEPLVTHTCSVEAMEDRRGQLYCDLDYRALLWPCTRTAKTAKNSVSTETAFNLPGSFSIFCWLDIYLKGIRELTFSALIHSQVWMCPRKSFPGPEPRPVGVLCWAVSLAPHYLLYSSKLRKKGARMMEEPWPLSVLELRRAAGKSAWSGVVKTVQRKSPPSKK